jgi:hypothetical protein
MLTAPYATDVGRCSTHPCQMAHALARISLDVTQRRVCLLLYSLTLLRQAFLLACCLLLACGHAQPAAYVQPNISPTCRKQFVTQCWESLHARQRQTGKRRRLRHLLTRPHQPCGCKGRSRATTVCLQDEYPHSVWLISGSALTNEKSQLLPLC